MWWTWEAYEYFHTSSDEGSTDYLRNYSIWPNLDCTDSRRNFSPLTGRDIFYPTSTYTFGCPHCSSSFWYCASSAFVRPSMVVCSCICVSLLLLRISSFASSCVFKLLITPSDCWSLDLNWSSANFSDLNATSKACVSCFSFSCSYKEGQLLKALHRDTNTNIHTVGDILSLANVITFILTLSVPKVMGMIFLRSAAGPRKESGWSRQVEGNPG